MSVSMHTWVDDGYGASLESVYAIVTTLSLVLH